MNLRIQSGRDAKGDLLVEIEKKEKGGLIINLKSSVLALFSEHLYKLIETTLKQWNITNAKVSISDNGALDFVIRARLEAAARQINGVNPTLKALKQRKTENERLRRTRLYLPGNNPDLMLNSGLFGSDCIILDLEDSVAPGEKSAARILVRYALGAIDFGSSERIVRINSLTSPYGEEDLAEIVPAAPDTLLIPKCESADDVQAVEKIVTDLGKRYHLSQQLAFMPLIESAKGILNAYEIARASDRNVALCFGAEDFTADIGVERTLEGKESLFARSKLILAAKAAGIQAIDTVYSDVHDMEGLVVSTRESITLGFEGRGVIHPAQIKPIHDVFRPTPEQIERAKQIVQAFQLTKQKGSGVTAIGSKMIDAPMVARAEKILSLAEIYGID